MKFFDHDDRRWMEGEHEGRWFALNEDGTRLVIERPSRLGYVCYIGDTYEPHGFVGDSMGLLHKVETALAWMFESDPTIEPSVVDQVHVHQRLTVSLAESPVC